MHGGTDQDDAGSVALGQPWRQVVDELDVRHRVEGQGAVHLGEVTIQERGRPPGAGVGDHQAHVEVAGGVGHRGGRAGLCQVHGHDAMVDAVVPCECGAEVVEAVGRTRGEHQVDARRGEVVREAEADARGGTSHDCPWTVGL